MIIAYTSYRSARDAEMRRGRNHFQYTGQKDKSAHKPEPSDNPSEVL